MPVLRLALVVFLVLGLSPSRRLGGQHRRGPGRLAEVVQHLAAQPAAARPADRPDAQAGAAVPRDLRVAAVHRRPRVVHPAPTSSRPSSTSPARAPCSTASRPSTGRWPQASCRRAATPRSTTLFSGGGMASMLSTVWLILGALELRRDHGGGRLPRPAHRADRRRGHVRRRPDHVGGRDLLRAQRRRGDQYVAVVLPSRVFRTAFARGAWRPGCSRAPSRTPARSPRRSCPGTAAAPTCPACSVCRLSTCRSAFFNILNPLVALVYAFTGFRVDTSLAEPSTARRDLGAVDPADQHRRSTPMATRPADRQPTDAPTDGRRPSSRRASRSTSAFTLPSAYTILFALIVITALATWIIPAGRYALDAEGSPIPGTYQEVDSEPAADHRRLAQGADQRPLRHRGPGHRQRRRLQQRRRCSAPSTSPCSSSSSAASSASR